MLSTCRAATPSSPTDMTTSATSVSISEKPRADTCLSPPVPGAFIARGSGRFCIPSSCWLFLAGELQVGDIRDLADLRPARLRDIEHAGDRIVVPIVAEEQVAT